MRLFNKNNSNTQLIDIVIKLINKHDKSLHIRKQPMNPSQINIINEEENIFINVVKKSITYNDINYKINKCDYKSIIKTFDDKIKRDKLKNSDIIKLEKYANS